MSKASPATSSWSDYFSWTRAKKNKEELEKTNPQNPVLNEADEQFLERIATQEAPSAPLPPSVIQDDGKEHEATSEAAQQQAESADTVALPKSPSAEEPAPTSTPATKDVTDDKEGVDPGTELEDGNASAETKDESAADKQDSENISDNKTKTVLDEKPETSKRTWGSYVPALPAMPTMPSVSVPSVSVPNWRSSKAKDDTKSDDQTKSEDETTTATEKIDEKVDEKVEGQMPPGVTITEDVKLDQSTQDEKDVSVILDRLHLSSINNRVFSFSEKSQKIYGDFTIVLKDMINGVPTAYDDMDKLLKENEGHLGETFASMPPFVQTLIKSLPAKMGTSLGPEVFAAASDKPGADMKSRLSAASKTAATDKKDKKRVPDVQSLAKQKGAVASMLQNIVNFLKLRFPFLLTTTNVAMTMSTFILLLVFWYCHKRGKEVRLSKAANAELAGASDVSEVEEDELDSDDVAEKADQEESPGSGKVIAVPEAGDEHIEDDSAKDAQAIIEQAEGKEKATT